MLPEQDGALRVTGLPLPRISDLAHAADVRLWELSPHQASLEEAYMRMTQGAVDYRSTVDQKAGLQQPLPPGAQPPVQMPVPGQGQPGWYAPPPPQQGGQPPFADPAQHGQPAGPYGAPGGPGAPAGGHREPVRAARRPSAAAARRPRPDQARGRPMSTPQQPPTQQLARTHPTGRRAPGTSHAAYTSPIPVTRTHLGHALASEWTKIKSVRSTMWTLGVSSCSSSSASACWSPRRRRTRTSGTCPYTIPAFFGLLLGQICLITLGVLVISSEYGTGMIRTTFTACAAARTGCSPPS